MKYSRWWFISLLMYMQIAMAQQIITFFVHGIHDSSKQALPFAKTINSSPYIIEGPLAAFDFDDAKSHRFYPINFRYGSLGQAYDLKQIATEWEKVNQQFPHADGFILIGVSRGASAILNFIATYKPKKIKALIIESAFDTIDSIIPHRAQRLGVPCAVVRKAIKLLFWKFDFNGICPAQVINQITDDIPMLFVTVKNDHSIPVESSKRLYDMRIANGYKHCHFLQLEHGRHGKLMTGPDAQLYQDITHAFYQHYGLPCNATYAQRGYDLFLSL